VSVEEGRKEKDNKREFQLNQESRKLSRIAIEVEALLRLGRNGYGIGLGFGFNFLNKAVPMF
jgi:hypothetical protein